MADTRPHVEPEGQPSPAGHYVRVLWQRRWWLLVPFLLLPVVAYVASERQAPVYDVAASVVVNSQPVVESSLIGVQAPVEDPGRYATTQTEIARSPAVVARVLRAAGPPRSTVQAFLRSSTVWANADVLFFDVRNPNAARAALLATEYARQFVLHRRTLDTRELSRTLAALDARIAALVRSGDAGSRLYASLLGKRQDVALLERLRRSNVFLNTTATARAAEQVAPRPVRNTALAAFAGLLLGLVLVFVRDAADTRPRSAAEIERRLGLPLLGRLPAVPGGALVVAGPDPLEADAFHTLRANVELASRAQVRSILVTSCVAGEGKSDAAANLGLAFARAGRRVLLADLDLRERSTTTCFGLEGLPGMTSLALGRATVDETVVPIDLPEAPEESLGGSLELLPAGPLSSRPAELASSPRLADVFRQLRTRADVVLVDGPPLLSFGDSLALSRLVDGVLLVARPNVLRRPFLDELQRLLDELPVATIGFVAADAVRRTPLRSRAGSPARGRGLPARPVRAAVGKTGSWR